MDCPDNRKLKNEKYKAYFEQSMLVSILASGARRRKRSGSERGSALHRMAERMTRICQAPAHSGPVLENE
jgi:hypothetical protein